MKTKYTLFRRGEMFYMQDSATGKQTSLRTKDETEAKSLLEARNAAQRQGWRIGSGWRKKFSAPLSRTYGCSCSATSGHKPPKTFCRKW